MGEREALESPVKQLNDLIVQPTKKEENSITLFNNSKTNDNEEPPVIFPLLHGTNGEDGTRSRSLRGVESSLCRKWCFSFLRQEWIK